MIESLRTSFIRTASRFILALPFVAAGRVMRHAQQDSANRSAARAAPLSAGNPQGSEARPGEIYGSMLDVPVSTLVPGAIENKVKVKIPVIDSTAVERGMKAFNA